MKLNEVPSGKSTQPRRWPSRIFSLVPLAIVFTIVPLYHPYIRYSAKKLSESLSSVTNMSIEPAPDITHPLYHSHMERLPEKLVGSLEHQSIYVKEKPIDDHAELMQEKPPEQIVGLKAGREKKSSEEGDLSRKQEIEARKKCDLFSGEWVENPEGPYYTNTTCQQIQEHQNCLKFGRPDTGFLKWRWKPYGCELPVFDPEEFLETMRGKSLAFVGDSVARNHMQSLICLLSRVADPLDVSDNPDQNFKRWNYTDYNFTISKFWSPYLVRTERTDPNDITKPFKLFLDEFDGSWTSQIESFDYVIISAGHWFFRPTMFYSKRRIIGCLYCPQNSITHRSAGFSYRRAFRTAFNAINSLNNFEGTVFLRTFAPSHFEGGPWDQGGDCKRTRPFKSNEAVMEDYSLEMYNIQKQEFRIGERIGKKNGKKIRLMDVTQAMLLRPDGHPSKYGHWPTQKVSLANDCVHWCLPGPIDSWNDFLLELFRREENIV